VNWGYRITSSDWSWSCSVLVFSGLGPVQSQSWDSSIYSIMPDCLISFQQVVTSLSCHLIRQHQKCSGRSDMLMINQVEDFKSDFECSHKHCTECISMHKLHENFRDSQNTVVRLYQCHICLGNYFHSLWMNWILIFPRTNYLIFLMNRQAVQWTPLKACHVVSQWFNLIQKLTCVDIGWKVDLLKLMCTYLPWNFEKWTCSS